MIKRLDEAGVTDEIFQEIAENCHDENYSSDSVYFCNVVHTDVINCSGKAIITIEDREYEMLFRNGNLAGFEVIDFGDDVEFENPKPIKYKFILDEIKAEIRAGFDKSKLEQIKKIYKLKYEDHQKKCSEYAYDRYFSPTNKIKKHYQEYMDKWCLEMEAE